MFSGFSLKPSSRRGTLGCFLGGFSLQEVLFWTLMVLETSCHKKQAVGECCYIVVPCLDVFFFA